MGLLNLTKRDLAILSGAEVIEKARAVRIGESLERAEYQRINQVLEAIGGKWNRGAKAHVFPPGTNVGELLDGVMLAGEVRSNPLEYFATPAIVVERLFAAAGVEPHHRVLEPSAGEGAIVDELLRLGVRDLTLVELDSQRCVTLRARGLDVMQGDFLELQLGRFDRVVMNPPFTKQQDIAHVRRAYELLAPGGRLVSVMAAGVEFREDRVSQEFRRFVARHGEMEPLPDDAFRASGTRVRTVMVTLNAEA